MKPILVVDDEAIVRESIRDWLKDSGYEVSVAESGEEALKLIQKAEFRGDDFGPEIAGNERH